MKIISKFKDFYDYKMAKYGVDEKLVYTRKTYAEYLTYTGHIRNIELENRVSEKEFSENLEKITLFGMKDNIHKILFIGDKLIHLFFTENGIYTHFDIKYCNDLSKPYINGWYMFTKTIYSYHMNRKEITFNVKNKCIIKSNFHEDWIELLSYDRKRIIGDSVISKDDIYLNEPIILIENIGEFDKKSVKRYSKFVIKITYNPNLLKLGVYIDEDFVWQKLVEFLSIKRSEKEIVPEVSNENKILSKGFDLKSSFRANMKKKK